jgi:hypothetical protein
VSRAWGKKGGNFQRGKRSEGREWKQKELKKREGKDKESGEKKKRRREKKKRRTHTPINLLELGVRLLLCKRRAGPSRDARCFFVCDAEQTEFFVDLCWFVVVVVVAELSSVGAFLV